MIDDISKLPAEQIMLRDEENREISIAQFFAAKYRRLLYAKLPCIIVKAGDKEKVCPFEVCEILPGLF